MAEPRDFRKTPEKRSFFLVRLLALIVFFGILAPVPHAYAAPDAEQSAAFKYDSTKYDTSKPGGVAGLSFNDGGPGADKFVCKPDGSTEGELFVNVQCSIASGGLGLFANVICRIENIFGNILGLLFCAVSSAIVAPLVAVLILYVTIYGAMVILGMVPHTFSEAIIRSIKIGLVCTVALNADFTIFIAYKFFILFQQTAAAVIFGAADQGALDTGSGFTGGSFDALQKAGYVVNPNVYCADGTGCGSNWMSTIDGMIDKLIGFYINAGVGLMVVMLAIMIFMPPLFMVLMHILLQIVKSLIQAINAYLLAVLLVTFLFSLAPIFVCFALFKVTTRWFDAWLKYIASYTLQILIIFAFLMLLLVVDITSFFNQVGNMIRSYTHFFGFGWIQIPIPVLTLCQVERVTSDPKSDILYYPIDTVAGATGKFQLYKGAGGGTDPYFGFPDCIKPYSVEEVWSGARFPPGLDQAQINKMKAILNEMRGSNSFEAAFAKDFTDGVKEIVDKANEDLTIPFIELLGTTDLIFFIITRFFAIYLLVFLMTKFMKEVPNMAGFLAGTKTSGRIGGGTQNRGEAAGVQDVNDYAGLDSGFAKFKDTYRGAKYDQQGQLIGYSHNPFTRPANFVRGIGAGASATGHSLLRKSIARGTSLGLRKDMRAELGRANVLPGDQLQLGDGEQLHTGIRHPGHSGYGQPRRGNSPASRNFRHGR